MGQNHGKEGVPRTSNVNEPIITTVPSAFRERLGINRDIRTTCLSKMKVGFHKLDRYHCIPWGPLAEFDSLLPRYGRHYVYGLCRNGLAQRGPTVVVIASLMECTVCLRYRGATWSRSSHATFNKFCHKNIIVELWVSLGLKSDRNDNHCSLSSRDWNGGICTTYLTHGI
jgi:hypothetical protein